MNEFIKFDLISNYVKGLQSYKEWLKLFEYLKNKIGPNGILFLQETLSTKKNEIRWNDNFSSWIHYFHSKSNSCDVLIAFLAGNGRILIAEALIDDTEFILINLYNANTENDQLTTFLEVKNLLENFDLTKKKTHNICR